MKKKITLLTPGPTPLSKPVIAALKKDIFHHKSIEFTTLYPKLDNKLKRIFKTNEGETLILTGSGTLGLDAGLASFFYPNDKVLVLSNGFFGDRLSAMAKVHNLNVIDFKESWTKKVNINKVEKEIKKHPDLKALLVVYSETSTGGLINLEAIGNLAKTYNLFFFVDTISGLIFNDFEFDKWNVDYAVSTSQKGYGMPPGVNFVCLSKKAVSLLRHDGVPFYFSLNQNLRAKIKVQSTPATPAVQYFAITNPALDEILKHETKYYKNQNNRIINRLTKELSSVGLTPVVSKKWQSLSIVAYFLPKGANSDDLHKYLLENYGIFIEKGLGEQSKNVIRIGLMAKHSKKVWDDLIKGIKEYLKYCQI